MAYRRGLFMTFASLLCLVVVFPVAQVNAADSISGWVTDSNELPLRATIAAIRNNLIVSTVSTGQDGFFAIRLNQGATSILIYSDNQSTPGYDYLPALIKVGSETMLKIRLEPAASLTIRGDILFVDTENIPTDYVYKVTDADGAVLAPLEFQPRFPSKPSNTIQIPGLPLSTVLVPAGVYFRLWLNSTLLVGNKVVTRSFSSDLQSPLSQGSEVMFDMKGPALAYNLGVVETELLMVGLKIEEMETRGFYLAREKGILGRANGNFIDAKLFYDSRNYEDGFDEAKLSYIDAAQTLGDLNSLYFDASSSVYILVGFLALSSIVAAFLLVDSFKAQIVFGALIYGVSLAVLYRVYPGSAITPIEGFVTMAFASLVVAVTVAVFAPRLMGSGGGDGRVSLTGLLVPVLSIAKRSLKRRRLQFALTLISLTVLVMSFVALTSLTQGYGLISAKTLASPSPNPGILIRSAAWSELEPSFISSFDSEIAWLARQQGVEAISVKFENVPSLYPIAFLSGNPINAVIGVNTTVESTFIPLASTVVEGRLPGPGGIALSKVLVLKLGLNLGDTVKLRYQNLTLEGILGDSTLYTLLDLDTSRYVPDKLENMNPRGNPPSIVSKPTPSAEVILMDKSAARLFPTLGATRIALKVIPNSQDAFAKRLSLDRGFQTWSTSASGIAYTALGSYFEGKGLPLIIPWAIVVLNVVVTMLNSLYERRREISILSAVGLNPAEIASIFVAEASMAGFIAGGLGYLTGLGFYKLMPLLGLALEVHQKVSAVWSLAAIGIAISAVLVGAFAALRSSIVITPSLRRRWRMKEDSGGFGKPWEVPVPMTLKTGELNSFVDYLVGRLKGLESNETWRTSNVKFESKGGSSSVSFIFKSTHWTTGDFTRNSVLIEPFDGEYIVRLQSEGGSEWVHKTGSLVRRIAMEWSNRKR